MAHRVHEHGCPSGSRAYAVRYVHKIAPSDKDTKGPVCINDNAFSNSKTLGAALRKAGVLISGGQVRNFRVEGENTIVFPSVPGLTTYWHSIILTPDDDGGELGRNDRNIPGHYFPRSRESRRVADKHELIGPGTDDLYKYRGASIELSSLGTRRWWATVRFRSEEKDFEARSSDEALEVAKDYIDSMPELGGDGRNIPGHYPRETSATDLAKTYPRGWTLAKHLMDWSYRRHGVVQTMSAAAIRRQGYDVDQVRAALMADHGTFEHFDGSVYSGSDGSGGMWRVEITDDASKARESHRQPSLPGFPDDDEDNVPLIRTSFTRITRGDSDDSDDYEEEDGWINEDGVEFEPDENDLEDGMSESESIVAQAMKFLDNEGATHASSSHFHPGIWYSTEYETTDYSTGEEEERSFHLEGFSPEEQAEIFKHVTRRR